MRLICAALLSALASPAGAICFPASGAGCFDAPGPYTPLVNPYPSHQQPLITAPAMPAFPPQASDSSDAGINLLLGTQVIESLDQLSTRGRPFRPALR